ncbi:energy transducer TonB [Pedobacter sp.]|uniref:energy transducer TonB n=1 Tax=Pedobacter sp. TaxID=1411316 RepID=UPI00396CDC84
MFNKTSNLYNSEWLALVFANRNKSYGAYVLRKQSSLMLVKAFLIAASFFIFLFLVPVIYNKYRVKEVKPVSQQDDMIIRDITIVPKKIEDKKEKPDSKSKKIETPKAAPVKVQKTVNLSSNINVVKDEMVTDVPPLTSELDKAVIGSVTQNGEENKGNIAVTPAKVGNGGGTDESGLGGKSNTIYDGTGIDVYPEFPGGMNAWAKYIQRNLRYPVMAQEEGVQGKVYLSFVIEKDGSITDVKVLKGIGYGCDEEAVRVIKKSPKWQVGKQNNTAVRVRYNMPISYTLAN